MKRAGVVACVLFTLLTGCGKAEPEIVQDEVVEVELAPEYEDVVLDETEEAPIVVPIWSEVTKEALEEMPAFEMKLMILSNQDLTNELQNKYGVYIPDMTDEEMDDFRDTLILYKFPDEDGVRIEETRDEGVFYTETPEDVIITEAIGSYSDEELVAFLKRFYAFYYPNEDLDEYLEKLTPEELENIRVSAVQIAKDSVNDPDYNH